MVASDPVSSCTLKLQINLCAGDLDQWVCTISGNHTPALVRPENSPLTLAPVVPVSITHWASVSEDAADIADWVAHTLTGDDMEALFSPEFLRRFRPSKLQANSIIWKRRALLRRQPGASKFRVLLDRRMAKARKRKAAAVTGQGGDWEDADMDNDGEAGDDDEAKDDCEAGDDDDEENEDCEAGDDGGAGDGDEEDEGDAMAVDADEGSHATPSRCATVFMT